MIPVIDMHCDTIALIGASRDQRKNAASKGGKGYSFYVTEEELVNGIDLRSNKRMIDLLRMKGSDYMCQCFALYVSEEAAVTAGMDMFSYLIYLSDIFDELTGANSDLIKPVLTGSDIEKNYKEGYMSALKTVEEGFPYGGKTENLYEMYRRGVRKSTLTWNFENELAFPNPVPERETDTVNGLKKAGFDFIEAMENMGMIIDISHLNDAGIMDIFSVIKPETPIVASHSNARGVCSHHRNLSDEMLKKLSDHGGVTGINFCPSFLNESLVESKKISAADRVSRIDDMIEHMKYIRNAAGIDVIALGSDFDGISGTLEVDGCGEIQKIAQAMDRAGFSDEDIEKVFYANALRVYKEVLG